MKTIKDYTDKELLDYMFAPLPEDSPQAIESKRRIELAKTDLYYRNFPTIEHNGTITYEFEGWSKEEIEDYIKNPFNPFE